MKLYPDWNCLQHIFTKFSKFIYYRFGPLPRRVNKKTTTTVTMMITSTSPEPNNKTAGIKFLNTLILFNAPYLLFSTVSTFLSAVGRWGCRPFKKMTNFLVAWIQKFAMMTA